MAETLRIHLLGPFEIRLYGNASAQNKWPSQQTQTIAKILITNRGNVVTSDKLLDMLWPDEPIESARSRLHVRISQLRNVLGENKALVRTVHNGYIFQPDEACWLDVDEFQTQISRASQYQEKGQQIEAIAAYEEARKIYRGDFLAEDLYADWTYNHREALHERYIGLLLELSECYAQQGRYRMAITRARQALIQDQLRETIYVRLMLYHYYAGERDQALRAYDRCKEILEKELGVSPLKTTLEIHDQIMAGQFWKNTETLRYPPPIYEGRLFEVPYALTEIPLIHRERELAWLISQWNDPAKPIILLEGEAGIGKSRLANTFLEYLTSADVKVLKVQLNPTDHNSTTKILSSLGNLLTENALNQLNTSTLAALAVLFPEIHKRINILPELAPLSPDGEHQRLKQAISALASVSASDTILFSIDDAQRLSPAAVDLISQLSKAFRVLLSYRSEDTPPEHPVRKLTETADIKLSPLSLSATEALILQLSGHDHPDLAAHIQSQTAGVPLFVVALLQHMFDSGQLFVNANDEWEMISQDSLTLPTTLSATIEARLNHLNPVQRRILDYAAIIGGKFDFNLLKASTRQSEERVLAIIDDLLNAGLIVEPRSLGKAEFEFSHDYYTEIACETLPSVRRKRMHLDVAQAIETLYARQIKHHFPELADHYFYAEKQEQAVHYATLASKQAINRFANDEALQYLEMALDLTPNDQILKLAQLRLNREAINDLQGKRSDQKDDLVALEANIDTLPTDLQAEIHLRRAGYEWILGNDENAEKALKKAIILAEISNAEAIEAKALVLAGRAASDYTQAGEYLNKALQIASRLNHTALEGDIIRYLGNAAYWQNNFTRSRDLFNEALCIHREVGDLRGELSALNNLGLVCMLVSDLPAAQGYYKQAAYLCQKIGDRLAEGVIKTNLGKLTSELGNYTEAESLLKTSLIIRDEIRNEEGMALALNGLGDVFRKTGRYELALTHYHQALTINKKIGHKEQTFEVLTGLAVLHRELGQYKEAQLLFDQAADLPLDSNAQQFIHYLTNASLLHTLIGNPTKALDTGEEARSLSKDLPLLLAPALKNIAHAYLALGHLQEAQEHFQKAYDLYLVNHQAHLAVEALAGLAKVTLLQGKPEKTTSLINPLIDAISESPLQGPDRSLWICLVGYQVLSACKDERAASVIEIGNRILQQRADAFTDAELRHLYLTGVSENCEISNIWNDIINID